MSLFIVLASTICIPSIAQMQENEYEAGECLKVEKRIFTAKEIKGVNDFHPGHLHAGVTIVGEERRLNLFYFRSDIGSGRETMTTLGRAEKTFKALNELLALGYRPEFQIFPSYRHPTLTPINFFHYTNNTNHWSIWWNTYGDRPSEVVQIHKGDVAGYRNRAPGGKYHDPSATNGPSLKQPYEINEELVAKWWPANLQDLCNLFICSREPMHTVGTFAGDIYTRIYHEARAHHLTGLISFDEWQDVLGGLSFFKRKALTQAVQFIPEKFRSDH